MKQIFFLILFVISLGANAQSKLDYAQYNNLTEVGYYGSICATDFGLSVPPFSVQMMPLFTVRFVPL